MKCKNCQRFKNNFCTRSHSARNEEDEACERIKIKEGVTDDSGN